MFTKAVLDDARIIFALVCADFSADLVEMDSEGDHVHRLVTYPPKVAILTLVESLTGVSSCRLRQNHPAWSTAPGRVCCGRPTPSPRRVAAPCSASSASPLSNNAHPAKVYVGADTLRADLRPERRSLQR